MTDQSNSPLLAIVHQRIDSWLEGNPRTAMAKEKGVRHCAEFDRVNALPRRQWGEADAAELAVHMTLALRRPGSSATLRPIQAVALTEIMLNGGMVGPIRVGGGKTLITLLAATVLGSVRPILLLPAKLIPKTQRNLLALARDWRINTTILIKSYDWISRNSAAKFFEEHRPDLLVLDEAHRARNLKASCTRRIKRYCEKYSPRVVAVSGTLIRKKLLDWAHLSDAALGANSPAPRRWNTIAHWGQAVDAVQTIAPGVLGQWCEPGEDVREAYQRRVWDTPGVVGTKEGLLGVSLSIQPWRVDLDPFLVEALRKLEEDWTLPDGFVITDPKHHWRTMRQLSLGVYYRYRVRPPEIWLEARREWGRLVRQICRYYRRGGQQYDSEHQIALAIDRGDLEDTGAALATWRAIKPTFRPEIEYVWVTPVIIDAIIETARLTRAIVWVESRAVGFKLHERGLTYYGAKGQTVEKRSILDADPKLPFAASVKSAGEGQDLQAWDTALITSPNPDAGVWEQTLGRCHRDGQLADEVNVMVAMLSSAHDDAWTKAMGHAVYLQQITGQEQKLLQADLIDLPGPEDCL